MALIAQYTQHVPCHACITISVMVLDGGRSIVNSRILWVKEPSLLKYIFRVVTSDNNAHVVTSDVCADSIKSRNSL